MAAAAPVMTLPRLPEPVRVPAPLELVVSRHSGEMEPQFQVPMERAWQAAAQVAGELAAPATPPTVASKVMAVAVVVAATTVVVVVVETPRAVQVDLEVVVPLISTQRLVLGPSRPHLLQRPARSPSLPVR